MEKLQRQHYFVVHTTIVLCAGIVFLAIQSSSSAEDFYNQLGLLNVGWPLIPAACIALYELFGWKFFNRALDYDGTWDFVEKQFLIADETGRRELDFNASGSMKIRQSVKRIAIVDGRTCEGMPSEKKAEFSSWHSVACNLDADTGKIVAALWHQSLKARPGGSIDYGVEEIVVAQRDHLKRPIRLTSTVRHTVGAGTPRFIECDYTRRQA